MLEVWLCGFASGRAGEESCFVGAEVVQAWGSWVRCRSTEPEAKLQLRTTGVNASAGSACFSFYPSRQCLGGSFWAWARATSAGRDA